MPDQPWLLGSHSSLPLSQQWKLSSLCQQQTVWSCHMSEKEKKTKTKRGEERRGMCRISFQSPARCVLLWVHHRYSVECSISAHAEVRSRNIVGDSGRNNNEGDAEFLILLPSLHHLQTSTKGLHQKRQKFYIKKISGLNISIYQSLTSKPPIITMAWMLNFAMFRLISSMTSSGKDLHKSDATESQKIRAHELDWGGNLEHCLQGLCGMKL